MSCSPIVFCIEEPGHCYGATRVSSGFFCGEKTLQSSTLTSNQVPPVLYRYSCVSFLPFIPFYLSFVLILQHCIMGKEGKQDWKQGRLCGKSVPALGTWPKELLYILEISSMCWLQLTVLTGIASFDCFSLYPASTAPVAINCNLSETANFIFTIICALLSIPTNLPVCLIYYCERNVWVWRFAFLSHPILTVSYPTSPPHSHYSPVERQVWRYFKPFHFALFWLLLSL